MLQYYDISHFLFNIIIFLLLINFQSKMPKQIIVIMEEHYPFGECEQRTTETTRVLVRKIYQVGMQQRNKLLQKVNILRKLKNESMIKVESVLEEEQSVHFLFEYIPIKLETWISNINDQFIQNFRDQLIKFSSFLANNFIKIEFQLKNIGMDQNYGAKYFLDLNFTVDNTINRQKLKSTYIREITNLFKPYILNTNNFTQSEKQRKISGNAQKEIPSSTIADRKSNDYSISPPTNKQLNTTINKTKQKALAQYYQQVNMSVDSENEKILQEFMDVLDNEGEQQIKNQPNQPVNRAQNSANSSQNQFQRQPSMQSVPVKHNQTNNKNIHNLSSNKISSTHQIKTNPLPFQFGSQNNFKSESATLRQINISQSTGRGKSELKQAQPSSEMWRESAQLQNRVKCAIQKSLSVIKKFKAIKDNSLI